MIDELIMQWSGKENDAGKKYASESLFERLHSDRMENRVR